MSDRLRDELVEALRTASNDWARDRRVRRAVPMVERQADAVLEAVEKHVAGQRARDHAEIEAQISEHVATRSQLAVVAIAEQRDAAVARAEAAEQALARVRELHRPDVFQPAHCDQCAVPYPCVSIRALDAATEGPRP